MANIYYIGVNTGDLNMSDPATAGTASTAGSDIELRIGDGTVQPTKRDVYRALEVFRRWMRKGGLGAGANLPAS